MKKIVLKDFLSLKKGDIISFSTDMDGKIYITVENREIDVQFYGNKKGKWGVNNPAPKSHNTNVMYYKPNIHFIWVKEKIAPFVAMEFKMPTCPKDLNFHLKSLYTSQQWEEMCLNKIITDLENQGAI